MPLPPSESRRHLHRRTIDLNGYERADGLYDIEAHLVDTKPFALTLGGSRDVKPGEPIHDMWIRLVVDRELEVKEVHAAIDASPYAICPQAVEAMQSLKGLRIGAGWTTSVRARLGGSKGCTHLAELLGPLATVAIQSLWEERERLPMPTDATGKPRKIDSCFAYASERELVRVRWPQYYDGPAEPTR